MVVVLVHMVQVVLLVQVPQLAGQAVQLDAVVW